MIVLYARCNRNTSVDNQLEKINRFAIKHNLSIGKSYIDEGYSCLEERPALNSLLSNIKLDKIDTIIMTDIARLSRNYLKVQEYEMLFKKYNVKILYIDYEELEWEQKIELQSMQDILQKMK